MGKQAPLPPEDVHRNCDPAPPCWLLFLQNKNEKPQVVQPRGAMFPQHPHKIMP